MDEKKTPKIENPKQQSTAPLWALQMEARITQKLENLMTIEDDLSAAIATLTANMTAFDAAVQQEITALQAALAANDFSTLSTAVQGAITNIGTVSTQMATDTAALVASVPGATPPAPTPAPTPAPAPSQTATAGTTTP